MWFLWILAAGWGALLSAFFLDAKSGSMGFMGSLFLLAVAWGPLTALTLFMVRRRDNRDAGYRAMTEAVGYNGQNGYEHREEASGIVLNREKQVLGLWEGRTWKAYAFEAVREWQTSKETPGVIVGGGLAGLGAALGAAQQAKAHSGLFVSVRDVDHPVWRIGMQSAKDQARWMEILRQEINRN